QRIVAQAKNDGSNMVVAPEIEERIHRKLGSGQEIDHDTQTDMSAFFGFDFSDVRVHTDSEADQLSRELNALAFTVGQDIFFRQEEYSPSSLSGRQLLAHELIHVVQQKGGEIQSKLTVGQPDDVYEQEADRLAKLAVTSRPFHDLQGKCSCGNSPDHVSECEDCSIKRLSLQR